MEDNMDIKEFNKKLEENYEGLHNNYSPDEESFEINSIEDLNQVKSSRVYATLNGKGSSIHLDVYLDEDQYSEAGVAIFGDNGDSTAVNVDAWKRGEKSDLFNQGWMIWGELLNVNGTWKWIPNDEYNQGDEDDDFVTFTDRKKFILLDKTYIVSKLNSLGISYTKII